VAQSERSPLEAAVTIVDIHCHTFNADDLPVKGFVKRVAGNRNALARILARALDNIIQRMADDAADELSALNALLASEGVEEAVPESVTAAVEQEADQILAEISAEDPAGVAEATAEIQVEEGTEEGLEGITDLLGVKRYVRWAALFGKRRLALTRALVQTYPEVDLFTPMLVDLMGLEDKPKSTILQQLEINEKISRLSMRGDLGATVHPFVGFDPRRLGAVPLAQAAVEHWGCVGIKLYPLMGFRPMGNVDAPPKGMTAEEAMGVDDALWRLYEWCQNKDVPITAHSSPSNQADQSFVNFSEPANWKAVLANWPNLHLNLGHFGWGGREHGWPRTICRMANDHPHLYADIGNHEIANLDDTFGTLGQLFDDVSIDTREMKRRFMFGTDWYMLASHRDYEDFLHRVRDKYAASFTAGLDRFMSGAALSFLGFDDSTNQNNQRLRARYKHFGYRAPGWLAA
jgi:predicted TIM-barrel fold metal-dependent hydrolase